MIWYIVFQRIVFYSVGQISRNVSSVAVLHCSAMPVDEINNTRYISVHLFVGEGPGLSPF